MTPPAHRISNALHAAAASVIMVRWPVLLGLVGVVLGDYTHEQVIAAVQAVFPPYDGSTLTGQGLSGVQHLQAHVLSTLNSVGCPPFPANPNNNGTWAYADNMLVACLWAKLGKMANEGVQSPGSGFAYFALNTMDGRVIRGRQDTESQRSITVLSALVVVLVVGLLFEGYCHSRTKCI